MNKFIQFIIQNPKKCLLINLLLLIICLPGLKYFQEKNDVRIWFRDNDPNIEILNKFERTFGNDENIVVAIHSKNGIFDQASIKLLRELTNKMWLVPQVIRVDSLINYSDSVAEGDEIIIDSFIVKPNDELDSDYLQERKNRALSHKVLPGYLISRDGKSALVFARLIPTLTTSPDYKSIVSETKKLIEELRLKAKTSGETFYLSGEATVNDTFREIADSDNALILPILFLLVIGFLFYTFRNVVAVMLPIIVTIFSVLSSLGICFYIGWSFNAILAILPAILIAISLADSVHIMVSYFQSLSRGESNEQAARYSLNKNLLPTILTTISTMIGFFSLSMTDLLPIRQLGVMAGIGCFLAWFFTIFFVIPILTIVPFKVPSVFKNLGHNENSRFNNLLKKLVSLISIHHIKILISFTTLIVLSLYLCAKNAVNSNPYDYFTGNVSLKVANNFILDAFGGNSGPELLIDSGKVDGIKDPVFLRKIEKLKAWLHEFEFTNQTIDVVNIVKQMNQSLEQGREEAYVIPNDQNLIAEELFLYTMGLPQGMDINNQMSLDYRYMRMTVLWSLQDTRSWLNKIELIKTKAKELGLIVSPTGKFYLFQTMMDYVVETFFKSVTMAFILVSILMMIVFKSVKLGLLSLIPNVLPLIFGGAFMYVSGISLNIGSSLVASVCLGIAVDDTIHFLSHFYRLKKQNLPLEEIFVDIFKHTGTALVMTTIILVSGFGLYIFGEFIPNVHFGLLCAVILTLALVIDLIFLPSLLIFIHNLKK